MCKINMYTFITRNSADYAEQLHKYCEQLKTGKNVISYYCVESVNCDRLPETWDLIGKSVDDLGHNCLNHADAMHIALNHNHATYNVFIDADMCILYPGWDQVIINELNKTPIWGTAFGDNEKQFNKYPNVFLYAFKKAILNKVDLNFNPLLKDGVESPVRKIIQSPLEARAFNKSIGEVLKCDTGWEIPLITYKAGIKSGYIKRVLGSDPDSKLPYWTELQRKFCAQKPTHMAEWHYKGRLFATHKQASRNHPLDGIWGSAWKDRIELYLENNLNT